MVMREDEKPKIEVKVSAKIAIPFWTMGAMYTAGALLSLPSEAFFIEPWYIQVATWVLLYLLWPVALGMLHAVCFRGALNDG